MVTGSKREEGVGSLSDRRRMHVHVHLDHALPQQSHWPPQVALTRAQDALMVMADLAVAEKPRRLQEDIVVEKSNNEEKAAKGREAATSDWPIVLGKVYTYFKREHVVYNIDKNSLP